MAIEAILFDKDGTLFDFEASWAGWMQGVIGILSEGSAPVAAALAASLRFDMAACRFAPDSPVIAGTLAEVAPLSGAASACADPWRDRDAPRDFGACCRHDAGRAAPSAAGGAARRRLCAGCRHQCQRRRGARASRCGRHRDVLRLRRGMRRWLRRQARARHVPLLSRGRSACRRRRCSWWATVCTISRPVARPACGPRAS